MARPLDHEFRLARPGPARAAAQRRRPHAGEAAELTGEHVDALLGARADDAEPADHAGPTPIEGIWLGVVAGIALWTLVAGAALLTWLG